MLKQIKKTIKKKTIKTLKKVLPIKQETIENFLKILVITFVALMTYLWMNKFYIAEQTYTREPEIPIESLTKATTTPTTTKKTVDDVIKAYFPNQHTVVKAILMHESRLNQKAINYNCIYKDGVVYSTQVAGSKSTFCKKGHEKYAWSVDCGIAQLNYHGQVCPAWTFELEPSLKKMHSMTLTRGFDPWVSYKTGAYKQYLTQK